MLKPTRALRALEWSSTLHLPRSTLPPRPLPEKRSSYLQQCTEDLYRWQRTSRPSNHEFVLHDGPPYANGSLHVGHALNKVLKDIICRFQLSVGRRVHYIPGWDCHGLPIEIKALKSQDAHTRMSPVDIRNAARRLAATTIEEQKQGFQNWAVMGDWSNAWQTMQKDFELRQLSVFKEMVEQGLIYRQFKPVHWSPSSGTALAEAELEYDEQHVSQAAYIKFHLVTVPEILRTLQRQGDIYALIWTTTPWTLPANSVIAVHSDLTYCVFKMKTSGDMVLVASARLDEVIKAANLSHDDIDLVLDGILGSQLAGEVTYINVLRGPTAKLQPVIHADFVTDSSGSGLVHCAPGHGFDDYNICRQLGVEIFAPVDDQGCFTAAAYSVQPDLLLGKDVLKEGSQAVIRLLAEREGGNSLIWATHKYTHKYPIDWRTKQPLIIRATAQWFADVDSIKGSALQSLGAVQFLPETGKARLKSFINGRSLWCISRQRAWGVPIPALYRMQDGKRIAVMTSESVAHIIRVIDERGIDAWWTDSEDDTAWIPPFLPPAAYTRGRDTMDVWFDSGTSWTMLQSDRSPPADVYVEGTDQHRGWFQSSLLTYIAHQTAKNQNRSTPTAPFKKLITHGFTLDQDGRKMSKSLGNVIAPEQIMNGTLLDPMKKRKGQKSPTQPTFDAMGPDALRLWVASSDYTRDVVIGKPILLAVQTSLHKYRITFKWLLGALATYTHTDFASSEVFIAHDARLTDRLALHQLANTNRQAYAAYTAFEPYKAVANINRYVNQDLSAFYFEAAKDLLYAGDAHSRLRSQHVCYRILHGLLQMLAPTLPLLVTEVLDHAPPVLRQLLESKTQDPVRSIWTTRQVAQDAEVLDRQLSWLTAAHDAVKAAQEEARAQKKMGSGLQCRVILEFAPKSEDLTSPTFFDESSRQEVVQFFSTACNNGDLEEIFVVSSVQVKTTGKTSNQPSESVPDAPPAWSVAKSFGIQSVLSDETGSTIISGRALVMAPSMTKCPRCWRYAVPPVAQAERKESESNPNDELCPRCEDVVADLDLLVEQK